MAALGWLNLSVKMGMSRKGVQFAEERIAWRFCVVSHLIQKVGGKFSLGNQNAWSLPKIRNAGLKERFVTEMFVKRAKGTTVCRSGHKTELLKSFKKSLTFFSNFYCRRISKLHPTLFYYDLWFLCLIKAQASIFIPHQSLLSAHLLEVFATEGAREKLKEVRPR